MEQTRAARVVLRAAVGTVARRPVAREAVRHVDQERPVPEELRGRGVPVPVHAGTRAGGPRPVLAGRRLRPGRQPAVPVQPGRGALRDDRRAEHGGLGATVLLRQEQLSDAVVRPAVGLQAAAVAQPGIFAVDRGQQGDCGFDGTLKSLITLSERLHRKVSLVCRYFRKKKKKLSSLARLVVRFIRDRLCK